MNQNQNNGFNSIQFNNLMMQYMMMNAYQRNMMHNALMMSNRNLAMGFNQPYTLNNVSKNNQKKQKSPQKEVENYNDDYEEDSFKEEKKTKVIKHYTKEELEEIEKWINARKRNFPSKNTVEQKDMLGKKREEAGMISKLELKLRKKVSILKKIDSRGGYNNNGYRKNNSNQFNKLQKNQHRNNNNNKQKKNVTQKANEPLEEGEIPLEEETKKDININEKKEETLIEKEEKKEEETNNKNNRKEQKNRNKERKAKENFPFRYKHNFLYDNMIKKELIIEENIILQAFRYFINEGLI